MTLETKEGDLIRLNKKREVSFDGYLNVVIPEGVTAIVEQIIGQWTHLRFGGYPGLAKYFSNPLPPDFELAVVLENDL